MIIEQEHWQAKGEFDEYFYAFRKGEITPAYAYLIPIESGIMAGEAVEQANESGKTLSSLYLQQIEGLNEFIRRTYRFRVLMHLGVLRDIIYLLLNKYFVVEAGLAVGSFMQLSPNPPW